MSIIKDLLLGFLIGIANIIPGVSGGTFLLVFGLYERVVTAISRIGPGMFSEFFSLLKQGLSKGEQSGEKKSVVTLLRKYDLVFLAELGFGAVVAVISLSTLMEFLLNGYFIPTYSFFFGLILFSLLIPVKLIKRFRLFLILFMLGGFIATVYVYTSVDPAEKAVRKSEIYREQAETPGASEEGSGDLYKMKDYIKASVSGAAAISAMVLPGISGSLVLILAGEYYTVVKAFSGLKDLQTEHMAYLFFLGIGIIVGLLLFARLVEYIFRRFHDQTIAFLCGLIAGSLYALWPFKEAVVFDKYVRTDGAITVVNDAVVYTNNNILPKDPSEFLFSMVFCVLGIAAMWCMSLLDKRQE